jgi:microcystin degradation protein MlrC
MRIGIGGLSCECCTFSPLQSTATDFCVSRGDSLLGDYDFLSAYKGVEFVPLLRARALPGGPIDAGFYSEIKNELLERLVSGGPWDGLFLHMHGAANVAGVDDAEADLFASIRRVVGGNCLLGASYDLHGNVSAATAGCLDILTAYRTAPHTDEHDTVRRACDLLVDCVRRGRPPVRAYIPVPVLLPGEKTGTGWEPGASLYAAIPGAIERYGLLDASVLIGYVWADEPRSTASVLALGAPGADPDRVQAAAKHLAGRFWESRRGFSFGTPAASADECIRDAMESGEFPVIVSDSGDNPTAGGAGDVPYVLERLLALGAEKALVAGIVDTDVFRQCREAGSGNRADLVLGGKLDTVNGKPLRVSGEVISIHDAPWAGGGDGDGAAVIRTAGVVVIVTGRRKPFHTLDDFLAVGIDPREFAIVAVKMGYLVPAIRELAARSLLALSPGAVNQDITAIPYRRIHRPMFPFDPDMDWTPPERSLV